jgi:hypothetical protein
MVRAIESLLEAGIAVGTWVQMPVNVLPRFILTGTVDAYTEWHVEKGRS